MVIITVGSSSYNTYNCDLLYIYANDCAKCTSEIKCVELIYTLQTLCVLKVNFL